MIIEKEIEEFVSGITKGPFRYLNDGQSDGSSEYVVRQNPEYADIYACAVYQAYLDMCRTVKGAGKGSKKKAVERSRTIVAGSLQSYFAGNPETRQESFDDWHVSVMCDACAPSNLTIGQAQKILNMAFKYLYCCRDLRESKSGHFTFCHMPLDGYTLAWYGREVDLGYDGKVWSAIDNAAEYANIEGSIRRKLGGESALLAEFGIWQKEKARVELRETRKAINKIVGFPDCPEDLRKPLVALAERLDARLGG